MDIVKHLIHLINAKITVQQQENVLRAIMDIFWQYKKYAFKKFNTVLNIITNPFVLNVPQGFMWKRINVFQEISSVIFMIRRVEVVINALLDIFYWTMNVFIQHLVLIDFALSMWILIVLNAQRGVTYLTIDADKLILIVLSLIIKIKNACSVRVD